MSIFLYRGLVKEVCVVKSKLLKSGLCHTLRREVQPVQFRVELTEFCDLEVPDTWHGCFERDGDNVFDSLMGEYICGAALSEPQLPEESTLPLVLPQGELQVDISMPIVLTFLSPSVELQPKFRRVDGAHMRTLPPGWQGSRLIWRLSECTLVNVSYLKSETVSAEGEQLTSSMRAVETA